MVSLAARRYWPLVRSALAHPGHAWHVAGKRVRLARRLARRPGCGDRPPPPLAYCVQLTRRCNLRCPHCFQWGRSGSYRAGGEPEAAALDLGWPVVEKLLARIPRDRPYFVFWGGEPFLWPGVDELLERTGRAGAWSTVCTNGTLLCERLPILRRQPRLALLVSLDGPAESTDGLRGPGVYRNVTGALRELTARRPHPHVGVEVTLLPETVGRLVEFCRTMAELGVDWVALNQRWFLGPEQQADHARVMAQHFGIEARSQTGYDAPGFGIDRRLLAREFEELARLRLPLRLFWQPPLDRPELIDRYFDEPARPLTEAACRKHAIRLDVMADGRAVTCKEFPDLEVGDLNRQEVGEVWHSDRYRQFRALIAEGPLPVCAKCPALAWFQPWPH